ncbi:MAG: hypothetical protein IH987_15790 [Planctomycetes bacterium]|nr:hypothetical protein [Planctomycetota bacterium]
MPEVFTAANVQQKLAIDVLALLRVEVVWMRQHQRHARPLLDELQLLPPDSIALLAKREQQRVILRHRVGQFYKAACNERPHAANSARHRLKRINVEAGRVKFDIQRLHPSKVTMGHRRAESSGAVTLDGDIDCLGSLMEIRL